jgi:hypothetical protein
MRLASMIRASQQGMPFVMRAARERSVCGDLRQRESVVMP